MTLLYITLMEYTNIVNSHYVECQGEQNKKRIKFSNNGILV